MTKKLLFCDIDGTIADRTKRLLHAMRAIYDTGIEFDSPDWYKIYDDPELLWMDKPVERARLWLWKYEQAGA